MDATQHISETLVIGRELQADEGQELEEERRSFVRTPEEAQAAPLTALCLSGGGIRSATFERQEAGDWNDV